MRPPFSKLAWSLALVASLQAFDARRWNQTATDGAQISCKEPGLDQEADPDVVTTGVDVDVDP